MKSWWLAVAVAATAAVACGGDFERMRQQPRYDVYDGSHLFADGKVMQDPPEGTIAVETVRASTPPITRALLDTGRHRFGIYCATCHGVLGDGSSPVADQMPLRRPPSLLDGRRATLSARDLYSVIVNGYGFMPPYAAQLPDAERWAVAQFVIALRLSQSTALGSLPPGVQQQARRALAGEAAR